MKKLLLLTILLATLVFVGSQAVADTITCPTTADVYIDQGSPLEILTAKPGFLFLGIPPKVLHAGF